MRQKEAVRLLAVIRFAMLFGGSRSGKSFILLYGMLVRACKTKSRHLIARLRFDHIKRSIGMDTLPKCLQLCFPELSFELNKSDWILSLPNGSEVWLAGTDDDRRVEKVLGQEFSTIWFNEVSEFKDYNTIQTVLTRLAEKNSLSKRVWYDCNPASKKHWSYKLFMDGVDPISGEPLRYPEEYASMIMNPADNLDNIDSEYIRMLEGMSKRQRQRFLEGQFLTDVEGALWTDAMISSAKIKKSGEPIKTIIAVDPAVTNNDTSDETGIVPCSRDENGDGIVHDDWSTKCSTQTWAQRVVNCYHKYDANYIVAETNQGGDLVVDAIKNIDRSVKVKKVHASKGKWARAEPIQQLYEQGKISHDKECPELEAEMTEWVPENSKGSPNRIDALVWGLTDLMIKNPARINIG